MENKNKKIISIIRPFDELQNIYVYEGKNKITSITSTIQSYAHEVAKLCNVYGVNYVEIMGPQSYTSKLGSDLQQIAATQYQYTDLQINYI